ncbi:MAG: alpha/beta hydrolase-fold protein [Bacteroidota bacterium]
MKLILRRAGCNASVICSITFLVLTSLLESMTARAQNAASLPEVQIPGTQSLKITSSIAGEDYALYVNLPRYYDDKTRVFPVLYLLDAQWDFPLVNAVFGEQYYDGFVPEIITVGITWGGKNPNYDSLRARDLTPTNVQQVPQSGNGAKFLSFIKKELIPFIDSTYRTKKNDRTLMGSSLGGLFTLYAMFHETELFNRYVLTSPSLGWDNEIIYTYEKAYADQKSQLPVRLFMAVGGYEGGIASFQKFVDHLKARNYQGLDLQTRVLEGIGHSGSKAEGYARGLQAVFARSALKIAPDTLQLYVGVYQLNPEVRIRVSRENDQLVLYTPDSTRVLMYAETEKDFYIRGAYLFVRFEKNEMGKVTGLHAKQFSGELFLKKVNE